MLIKKIVGIYKVPAIWDRLEITKFIEYQYDTDKLDYILNNTLTDTNEHSSRITNITDNIYFELFENMSTKYSNYEKHYIFIDENLKTNTKRIFKNINIWILKSHNDLCYFRTADIFFLRGNYLNYYHNFILNKEQSRIIFYPATSLQYVYYKTTTLGQNVEIKANNEFKIIDVNKKLLTKIDHIFYKIIDTVLIHENNDYLNIFKNVKHKIIFNKPSSMSYSFLNLSKVYDFIFVGDATQHTKNHHLAYSFIDYCEQMKINITFLYVSDASILQRNVENFTDTNVLKYVKLKYINYLTPFQMCKYYNESRINLILSGRDAFPRTISESLACGCYNIALDTLSDGKNIINNIFGTIVGDKNGLLEIRKSCSLSYKNNNNLWEQILNISNQQYDYEKIAYESIKLYNYNAIS
jgi:hypothetical protein|tara:strand:- start:3868 stop:5100 length:1233 start_codon:yes stop_codon:yes gene_type:complete